MDCAFSLPSAWGIIRSCHSDSQMNKLNKLSGWTVCFHCHLRGVSSGVVSLAVRWTNCLEGLWVFFTIRGGLPPDRLYICLPERPLLKMPYIHGGKTSCRWEFSHKPQPSNLDNRVLHLQQGLQFLKYVSLLLFWLFKLSSWLLQTVNS